MCRVSCPCEAGGKYDGLVRLRWVVDSATNCCQNVDIWGYKRDFAEEQPYSDSNNEELAPILKRAVAVFSLPTANARRERRIYGNHSYIRLIQTSGDATKRLLYDCVWLFYMILLGDMFLNTIVF